MFSCAPINNRPSYGCLGGFIAFIIETAFTLQPHPYKQFSISNIADHATPSVYKHSFRYNTVAIAPDNSCLPLTDNFWAYNFDCEAQRNQNHVFKYRFPSQRPHEAPDYFSLTLESQCAFGPVGMPFPICFGTSTWNSHLHGTFFYC